MSEFKCKKSQNLSVVLLILNLIAVIMIYKIDYKFAVLYILLEISYVASIIHFNNDFKKEKK